jgi:YbbR domain-containing protein
MMRRRRATRRLLSDMPVKVICLAAAVILFLFHRINTLTERFFSVPLLVEVPAGLAVASSYPRSVRITLRGAEEAIYPILEEDIEAGVNLEGKKGAGSFRAPVRVSRKGTAANVEPLEIKVEPQEITFTLEQLVERRLTVVPDLRGSPAYGFELVQYGTTPQSVVVRGARSHAAALSALSTEQIDLSGRTGPFSMRVRVAIQDPLLRVAGDPTVEFKAAIQETVISRRYEQVEVAGLDLSTHLSLKGGLPVGSIQVQGALLAVEGFKPEQLRLLMDCSGVRRPGVYTLRLRPQTPSNVTVLDYSPRELTVEFVPSGR